MILARRLAMTVFATAVAAALFGAAAAASPSGRESPGPHSAAECMSDGNAHNIGVCRSPSP